ncbi:hypothetical protein EJB05_44112, partial [Eragrostis curvula]
MATATATGGGIGQRMRHDQGHALHNSGEPFAAGHPVPKKLLPMDGAAEAGGSREPAANGAKPEEKQFDPSRMIGIIKRKALIKELAAAYHAECIASCKELLQLQLQMRWEEEKYAEAKMLEAPISTLKAPKRRKR